MSFLSSPFPFNASAFCPLFNNLYLYKCNFFTKRVFIHYYNSSFEKLEMLVWVTGNKFTLNSM